MLLPSFTSFSVTATALLGSVLLACGGASSDAPVTEGALTQAPASTEIAPIDSAPYVADDTTAYWLIVGPDDRSSLFAKSFSGSDAPRKLWEGGRASALALDETRIYFATKAGAKSSLLAVSKAGGAAETIATVDDLRDVLAIAAERAGDHLIVELSDSTMLYRVSKKAAPRGTLELTEISRVTPTPREFSWRADGEYVYALSPQAQLVAYPIATPTIDARKVLWKSPATAMGPTDPGPHIHSFTVTKPGSDFVAFGIEWMTDTVTRRRDIVMWGSGGNVTIKTREQAKESAQPVVDASTHCAITAVGANESGTITCAKAGDTTPFIAVPFYGRNLLNLSAQGNRLLWSERLGSLRTQTF